MGGRCLRAGMASRTQSTPQGPARLGRPVAQPALVPSPCAPWFCSLLKQLFQVHMATVSLVESDEINFLARAGQWACRTNRAGSLCDYFVGPDRPRMLIIEDTHQDARCGRVLFV